MGRRGVGGWAKVPEPERRPPAVSNVHSTLGWLEAVGRRPTVEGLRDALDFFERFELDVVERLREDGTTWDQLRHAYGVSTPQGARLRVLRLRERRQR